MRYYPDFLVEMEDNIFYIVETKGGKDPNLEYEAKAMEEYCDEINSYLKEDKYRFAFICQTCFDGNASVDFQQLLENTHCRTEKHYL